MDCVLENVGELTASRQGGDLLEIESKGICWICDVREVHSHGGAQSSRELKPQMQGPRTVITSGCKSDGGVDRWTEFDWTSTL